MKSTQIRIRVTPLFIGHDFVFCGVVASASTKRQGDAALGWAGGSPPTSPTSDHLTGYPPVYGYGTRDTPGSIGAAFVRKRLRLQHQLRALKEAHEQGLALDMAIAAEQLEVAAVELAANVRRLHARKARMEAHVETGRDFSIRKAHADTQVQNALYETRALQEWIADLFEECLRPDPPEPSSVWPNGRPPAQSYPWLRMRLESCAVLIEHTLTLHAECREEQHE
jgi:hypothetical protein